LKWNTPKKCQKNNKKKPTHLRVHFASGSDGLHCNHHHWQQVSKIEQSGGAMLAANRAQDEWIGVSNDCQRAGIAKSNVPTEHWLTSPSLKDKTRSRNIEHWKVRTATPAEKDIDIDEQALAGVTADSTWLKLNTFPEPLLGIDFSRNQPICDGCDGFVEGNLLKEGEAVFCQSNLNAAVRAAATQPPSPASHVASLEPDVACLVVLRRRGFELDRARENEMRKRVFKARALWRRAQDGAL